MQKSLENVHKNAYDLYLQSFIKVKDFFYKSTISKKNRIKSHFLKNPTISKRVKFLEKDQLF